MTRLSSFALAIAVCLGAAAMVASSRQPAAENVGGNFHQATEAAFRDGLYLGRLAAERGQKSHVCAGRWSRPADRQLFIAGYSRGYHDVLAARSAAETSAID